MPEITTGKKRVVWIDTLKFIGIYTIYIAHFLDSAGYLYKFACMYVIQLFFFVSGFFALKAGKEQSIISYVKKQGKHLLVPYFIFSIVNIGIIVIQENRSVRDILPLLKQMVYGIRNQLFAPALWFLPCLFIVSILFFVITKIVKKAGISLAVSLGIYCLVSNLLPFDATETPKWIFNIDSALYYLFFYALGAFVFPYLEHLSWNEIKQKTGWPKYLIFILGAVGGVVIIIVSALTFFGRKDYFIIYPVFAAIPVATWTYPIFIALCIIIIQIIIAMWLQRIPYLAILGKHTLAFCGNETIVKTLVPCIFSLIGLTIQITTPLHAYVYAFILLIISNYVMIPIEKKLFPKGIV